VDRLVKREIDIAVIGGGAAGLAAAIKAKEKGIENVVILERNEELGGILPQCIHTGFGLRYFKENLTGPGYISRFIKKAEDLQIESKLDTMVLEITSDKKIIAVNSVDGLLELRAKAIVLAMGCRERTRGALGIAGTRPAGILTAGTAQRLMDIEGYMPGAKVVILGSGDVGLIMARRFVMEGAKVEAVVEILPYASGLSRNVVQCLEDFNIPLLLGHTVTSVHGIDRVEAVTVAKVDVNWRPIQETERTIECDTLILSVGLIPENELSQTPGVVLDPATGGPVVNEHMETSVEGIFGCGNVVHVYDLVDHVTQAGELAGESAARYVLNELPPLRKKIALKAGSNVKSVVPQIISGAEPVILHLRVKKPMRNVKVKMGNLSIPKRVVRPPEMVVINLTEKALEKLEKRDELEVSVEEETGP
jgi:NADPH-dependent 2,4-dienoyl-CoA reductase/sulfur reductase-like enzyme